MTGDFASLNVESCAKLILRALSGHLDVGNSSNGSQCLAAKSFGGKVKEILCLLYFRSGVPFESKAGVGSAHTYSIVDDLEEAFTCVLDDKRYFGSTSIDSVFKELLDG